MSVSTVISSFSMYKDREQTPYIHTQEDHLIYSTWFSWIKMSDTSSVASARLTFGTEQPVVGLHHLSSLSLRGQETEKQCDNVQWINLAFVIMSPIIMVPTFTMRDRVTLSIRPLSGTSTISLWQEIWDSTASAVIVTFTVPNKDQQTQNFVFVLLR